VYIGMQVHCDIAILSRLQNALIVCQTGG
jgi:hypothetical protein